MKFLLINGKLYKRNSDNKIITIPDNYNNEPLTIGGNILTIGGKLVGDKYSGSTYPYVMPAKGDLVTIESKQYRVLKTSGTVAEVLCMYNAASSLVFDTNSSYSNTYANKNIDIYCNNTFYSELPAAVQQAIVPKTFTQDSWRSSDYSSDNNSPALASYIGTYNSGYSDYTISLINTAYDSSITRNCYCLSIQDIIDYLEVTENMTTTSGPTYTTLNARNIWRMFWNKTREQSDQCVWLRSALHGNSINVFYIMSDLGMLMRNLVNDGSYTVVRPAFQIDLSKISWESST